MRTAHSNSNILLCAVIFFSSIFRIRNEILKSIRGSLLLKECSAVYITYILTREKVSVINFNLNKPVSEVSDGKIREENNYNSGAAFSFQLIHLMNGITL